MSGEADEPVARATYPKKEGAVHHGSRRHNVIAYGRRGIQGRNGQAGLRGALRPLHNARAYPASAVRRWGRALPRPSSEPLVSTEHLADECASGRQRAATCGDLLVKQVPGVDHVRPHFQRHPHVGCARRARKPYRIAGAIRIGKEDSDRDWLGKGHFNRRRSGDRSGVRCEKGRGRAIT
jgi:hypothetical protein